MLEVILPGGAPGRLVGKNAITARNATALRFRWLGGTSGRAASERRGRAAPSDGQILRAIEREGQGFAAQKT
jgi:hypothetical protein